MKAQDYCCSEKRLSHSDYTTTGRGDEGTKCRTKEKSPISHAYKVAMHPCTHARYMLSSNLPNHRVRTEYMHMYKTQPLRKLDVTNLLTNPPSPPSHRRSVALVSTLP